jgi:apolipoprotein N-acyltransferase
MISLASSTWNRRASRVGLALLTAGLLVLSFPNPDQGWLAWVALVPLLLACHGLGTLMAGALGLLSGVATAFGIFRWLFEITAFGLHHALILALYLGLYPAAWCSGLVLLAGRGVPLIVTGPALWVALDYLKAHAAFMALPWATLAHSQHRNLAVLQLATLTGEYGVTFLVVMASVAVAGILTRRAWLSAAAAATIIALAHGAGAVALSQGVATPSLRVAVVQPSILIPERSTAADRAATLERLERLTQRAAAKRPALIAWPETAVLDLAKDPGLIERVQTLARAVGTPLVVGASEFVKFPRPAEEGKGKVLPGGSYNSAYLVVPGQPLGAPYHKMLLVPFGEYLPLQPAVRWPAWLVPKVFNSIPGDGQQVFTLPDGTVVGTLICWENLFAGFVRAWVSDGAQLLVQLTNDNWFGPTAAPWQHNLASVLRAVENRVPVVIASNTGPSQIVDPHGRIRATVPRLFVEGVAVADVPLGSGGTVYTRAGDLFVLGLVMALALSIASPRPKRDRNAP